MLSFWFDKGYWEMSEKLYHPVFIGDVELPGNILMAPMAGVTDLPYRILCKEMGVSLSCTEMVSAKAILYGNKNTDSLLEKGDEPGLRAVQLFGSDPAIISIWAALYRRWFGTERAPLLWKIFPLWKES